MLIFAIILILFGGLFIGLGVYRLIKSCADPSGGLLLALAVVIIVASIIILVKI